MMNFTENECGICGELHSLSECLVLKISKTVSDRVLPSKARSTLPEILNIETMADGSYAIIANSLIEKGTQFGPLEAQKLLTLDPTIIFPLKLFNNTIEDFSAYYLNTSDEYSCNWIMFITPAQCLEEQNLVCFQEKSKIIYVSLRDIKPGEHLKVWYSTHYAKQMNKELLTSQKSRDVYASDNIAEPIDLNKLLKKQQKINDRENWTCKFCGKLEKDVTLFATHIIEHYNKKVTKDCEICNKSFPTLKILRRHKKIEHPIKPAILPKSCPVINQKSKDAIVGGPLLNDLLTDSLDNTNLVLPNIELNVSTLETDALNLAVDNLITENVKELDHFNFEIVESQEQYVCDICLKGFSKLYYLLQHLKKHTGRYTCGHCLKIFCRKENLKSHNCISNDLATMHKCTICDKSFLLKKQLMRHIYCVHERRYACKKCNKVYDAKKEYDSHYCGTLTNEQKPEFSCTLCSKKFDRERYLRKHLLRHNKQNKQTASLNLICEICGVLCQSRSGMYLHRKNHMERTLACYICGKSFFRKSALDEHLLSHCDTGVKCNECNKMCKTKKTLAIHMRLHKGVKLHKCDKCPRAFTQLSNLKAHITKVHLKTCKLCNRSFSTVELLEVHKKIHRLKEYYSCPICVKYVKLKSSLQRHIKKNHPDHNVQEIMSTVKLTTANIPDDADCFNDDKNSDNPTLDQLCNVDVPISELHNSLSENDSNNFDSIVDNFENIINSYRNEDLMLNSDNTKTDKNEKRFLDFTELQMDMDTTFDLQQAISDNNQGLCLSMPDLADADQEIMLGDSAYILDNGTIVEPKEQGNVLVYVLDKTF